MLQELPDETSTELNDEQKQVTDGVIIAASCPLVMMHKDVDGLKKKIIGVLNAESRSPASTELFIGASIRDDFYKEIVSIAKIYLNLHYSCTHVRYIHS